MSHPRWPWRREPRVVLQSEAAECGLACIVMVANHHGHDLDLTALRRTFPMSLKGMTLKDVMSIASALELAPRAVRIDLHELKQLQLPAVLHWDLNHFVVLEKLKNRSATVLDPARGRRTLALGTLSKHFTGVALELEPAAGFVPITGRTRLRLRDLWSRMRNYSGPVAQVLTLSLIVQVAAVVTPFFVQLAIDEGIGQGDLGLLNLLFVSFAVVLALQAAVRGLRNWVTLCLGQSLSFQLGGNLVRHLLRLPVDFFERRHIGDVTSRFGAVQPVQHLLSQGFVNALIDAGLVVLTLIVMALISPLLSALVVGTCAAYLVISQVFQPELQRRTEEELVARAEESTYLIESIRSVRAIKLHTHESMRESGWRNRFTNVVSASYRRSMVDIRLDFVEEVILSLTFLLTVYFGAREVLGGSLSVGMLVAFFSYRASFTQSAVSLIDQLRQWRLLSVHLERLADIVTEPKEDVRHSRRPLSRSSPRIEVAGLSFSYGASEEPIFTQANFSIPPGALVAIVGPSGAGKTTLMRLLLGVTRPSGGSIRIDGVKLDAHSTGEWRSRIGAVMQDDYLLSGSLAENISFFDPQPDQARIERAARFACVDEDIRAMPMAYQSLVNDMGAALSAGQRQRIMLARAMYRSPDVLFLDEGTANLDPVTESRIADAVAALPITRIVIAHRPALIERADYILTVGSGHAKLTLAGGVRSQRSSPLPLAGMPIVQ